MKVVVRKPYRFITTAIALSCLTLFLSNVIWGTGVLLQSPEGEVVGWAGGIASVLLVIGMLHTKVDRFIHAGLLLAGFAWITRTAFIGIEDGLGSYPFWLSVAWVIVVVGTFLLEANDPLRRRLKDEATGVNDA
jgi:hypothetical protein